MVSHRKDKGERDLLPLHGFFDRIKPIRACIEETVHVGQSFESGAFDNIEDGYSCYAVFGFLESGTGLDDHGASHTVPDE